MKYTEPLAQLGLSKNEAEIYETLVVFGELSVGEIAKLAGIHRRNVYDCMNRLLEKGLVVEILASQENHYKAVDPQKLKEIIAEKKVVLNQILPALMHSYREKPHREEVYILKGLEGWKNYMREILRLRQDVYTIGGGGLWGDDRMSSFLDSFLKEAKRSEIKFHVLYDQEVTGERKSIIGQLGENYRFLPADYSTEASVDIFGDHVVILTKGDGRGIDDSLLTVIINQKVADAMRTWWQALWSISKK